MGVEMLILGVLVSAQLASVGRLPQILTPAFRPSAALRAGKRGEVIVSFTGLKDYRIDRLLPIALKLTTMRLSFLVQFEGFFSTLLIPALAKLVTCPSFSEQQPQSQLDLTGLVIGRSGWCPEGRD